MSLSPQPLPWPTSLYSLRANPPTAVPAIVSRGIPAELLAGTESFWGPERATLAQSVLASGGTLENAHWDWRRKVARVARGEMVAFAVECDRQVQGLMAAPIRPRWSVLTPGRSVVYVDYLEAAPWNHPAARPGQRYAGVGTVLIGEAIRFSLDLGLGGGVGLHSLPQAEGFYVGRCGMRRVGPDPAYYDLEYFEYPDGVAAVWLAARGRI